MNRVELEGYVGSVAYSGPFCRISLATQWQGKTTWHTVKMPPTISELVKAQKGMRLYVCGFLTSESYMKDGQKKTWYGIIATGARVIREPKQGSTIENKKTSLPELSDINSDSDIPF